MIARHAPLAATLLLACSARTTPPSPANPSNAPAVPTATYEVHEWGLIQPSATEDALEVGTAPRHRRVPVVVKKPVLYFHTPAQQPPLDVRVTVTPIGGEVVEHWPLLVDSRTPTLTWPITLTGEPAGPACAGRWPADDEPPCATLALGTCEAAGLDQAIAPSASCVVHAGARWPLLFYRSDSRTFTPPLALRRGPDGALVARNTGTRALPGSVLWLRRAGAEVRASVNRPPPPGGEVVLNLPRGDAALAKLAVDGTLTGLGLTDDEADAFGRAWDHELFDAPAAGDGAAQDTVLWFLPEATVDEVATLAFEPPPARVRRAMAVWEAAP